MQGKKHAPLAPMYRPLSSYKFGEEPQIVYFMMLFVKKDEDLKQFRMIIRIVRRCFLVMCFVFAI